MSETNKPLEPLRRPGDRLYLDDLHVGQRFTSGTYVMEAARIKEFAAEFDPQPFHLDETAAEASVFKTLVASGWHTAAVAMRLLVTGGLPLANGIVGFGGDFAWPRPTRPGDILRLEIDSRRISNHSSKGAWRAFRRRIQVPRDEGFRPCRCRDDNPHCERQRCASCKMAELLC